MSNDVTIALILGICGVLGTVGGVTVAAFFKNRQLCRERKQIRLMEALSLQREFLGGDIAKARQTAHVLLTREWNVRLNDLENRNPNDASSFLQILDYYAGLYSAIKHGRIEADCVPTMFGEAIVWWWIICFAGRADYGEWCSYDAMAELNRWLEEFCSGSAYEADYKRWVNGAQKYRAEHSPHHASDTRANIIKSVTYT